MVVTFASLVYERLRADILAGVLSPVQKLRIESICEHYDVGNSSARDALNRLSAERLVERGSGEASMSLLLAVRTSKSWCERSAGWRNLRYANPSVERQADGMCP